MNRLVGLGSRRMLAVVAAGWVGVVGPGFLGGAAVGGQAPGEERPAAERAPGAAGQPGKVDEKTSAEARRVLDRVRAHYAGLKGAGVTAKMTTTMKMEGVEQANAESLTILVARPNRVSIHEVEEGGAEGGLGRYAIVSDGKTFWQYMGTPLHKYSEAAAPATLTAIVEASSLDQAERPEAMLMSPHVLALALMDGRRFDDFCKGAKIQYIGREELDGHASDHLRFTMERFDADMWVRAAGEDGKGDAWVEKVVPDRTRMLAELGAMAEQFRDQMPKEEITLSDWTRRDDPGPEAFTFKAPEGAEKVASLEEAMRQLGENQEGPGEDPQEKLVGKPAPELALDLLDGGKVSLGPHKGKDVVILDFWATWCPPCVQGLPIVSKAAAAFKDKGVVFYAVNQQEPAEKVRAFLKKKELAITVAMDTEGKAASAYAVGGIPQTVLIGRDGTVQAVHVGFAPGMEGELTRQIQMLVDGKALVKPGEHPGLEKPLAEPGKAQGAPEKGDRMALDEAWSIRGSWNAVAADPASGEIYAVKYGGRVQRLDREGQELGSFKIKVPRDDEPGALRLANLAGDAKPELVLFRVWGKGVRAFDTDGNTLWEHVEGDGVDDVWVANLDGKDGDGRDEVIVGYNGGTGVHVLGPDGKLRWKNEQIGNVWHVCAGVTRADGPVEVVTTSAAGQVHIFDREGKKVADMQTGGYASLVRLVQPPAAPPPRGEPPAAPLIVSDASDLGGLSAVDRSGRRVWRADLGGEGVKAFVVDAVCAPDRPWLALAMRDGHVLVFDAATGDRLATATGSMGSLSVAWAPGKDGKPPELVIATSDRLTAWVLREVGSEDVKKP